MWLHGTLQHLYRADVVLVKRFLYSCSLKGRAPNQGGLIETAASPIGYSLYRVVYLSMFLRGDYYVEIAEPVSLLARVDVSYPRCLLSSITWSGLSY